MGYEHAANLPDIQPNDPLSPTPINEGCAGLQAEIERHTRDTLLAGVLSSGSQMACSISGSTVLIADGEAFVAGRRYSGNGGVHFSSLPNGTYHIFIDPTNDTSPFQASTTPASGYQLPLCRVVNTGYMLSDLVDERVFGLLPWSVSVGADIPARDLGSYYDGATMQVPATPYEICVMVEARTVWIEGVLVTMGNPGTSGETVIDVHVAASGYSPTTIFTDQTRRPTVASGGTGYTIVPSGIPDTNRLMTGPFLISIWLDEVASDGADLDVCIYGRFC